MMGFFSARRPEEHKQRLQGEEKVVRVIRSRFYGKYTGNAPNTLSNSPSSSLPRVHNPPTPAFNSTKFPQPMYETTNGLLGSPRRSSIISDVDSTHHSLPTTDSITMTLAQRLDELSVANSEGLLNDDEYRLLRQSLFDRFAAGSSLPSETPLVPVAIVGRPDPNRNERGSIALSHHRRPSSQLNRQSPRTASAPVNKSFTSTVAGMLKRATSRRKLSDSVESHKSETNSIFSTGSSMVRKSGLFRRLSKHTSAASLRNESSLSPPEVHTPHTTFDSLNTINLVHGTDSISRSTTRSARRAPTSPPSSYHRPALPSEIRRPHTIVSMDPDDEFLQSAQEIRHEIELVEAEGRRLLDAFNGLELSTLVRQQRLPGRPPLSRAVFHPDGSSISAEQRSVLSGNDMDTTSIKSSGSMRTMGSTRRLAVPPHSAPPLPDAVQLLRKNSISTMSSHSKIGSPGSPLATRPSFRSRLGSSSSVNLARSTGHLPLATVAETGGNFRIPPPPASTSSFLTADSEASFANDSMDQDETVSQEMADIRKRREEVTARYEARLEYLRARLKGAELREKLMKK